jgi:uncharacterized protein YdaU (DUF1376 family)
MEIVMHFYQFNIGDYRRDASHLTLLEHGVYRQLLDTYYLDEKPLTRDLTALMRTHCIRSAEEQQALKNVLKDFFDDTPEGFIHRGCDRVIEAYRKKSRMASESAKARWSQSHANALPTESESNADGMLTNNHKPITNNQEPIKKPMQRGTRLPADSPLSEDWILFCRQERPDLVPSDVYAEFRDYWVAQPGQKGVKTDWPATWRNWVRRQKAKPQQSAWQQKESRKQDHYNQIFGERSDDGRTIDATPLRLG